MNETFRPDRTADMSPDSHFDQWLDSISCPMLFIRGSEKKRVIPQRVFLKIASIYEIKKITANLKLKLIKMVELDLESKSVIANYIIRGRIRPQRHAVNLLTYEDALKIFNEIKAKKAKDGHQRE